MWFLNIILVLFTCAQVFGEDSFNHDFGEEFNEVFQSDSGLCLGMGPWRQGNYSTIDINPPQPDSLQFVEPGTSYSCIYSTNFMMSPGGQLELSIYMDARSSLDQIRLFAYDGKDNSILGIVSSSLDSPNFQYYWNTLNLNITTGDDEPFEGFVLILGRATSASNILVDHIQYIPPEGDDDTYDPAQAQCIEQMFDDHTFGLFFLGNSNEICNIADDEWVQLLSEEISGIVPSVDNTLCCVASPPIPIYSSGTLYIEVLVDSASYLDYVSVAINDDEDNYHFVTYGNMVSSNVTSELQTLEIPLDIKEEYHAQISLIGLSTPGATVLVKSFKFMPSRWDQEDCIAIMETRRQVN